MNGTDKKILLVEDEPIAQRLYQNRLQREGFQISFAEDGEVALASLSKEKPDLVVLDLMLPKVNGPEVLKHIRTEDRLKSTPVLVISNAYMSELSQKAMESGATRGMLKTECTPARLVETVRDMLGFRSAFELSDKPDDKQTQDFEAAARTAMDDEMMLKEKREEFIQKAPGDVAKMRELCLAYIKVAGSSAAEEPLGYLYKQVRFFATRAGLSGCVRIALLASAFEALLFEAVFKPGKATPSVSQTFAQAVDCLERLAQTNAGANEVIPKARILVVDDDAVCNLAMVGALKRAHFEPVSVEDPQKAVEMAQTARYDVVFLDINMPVLNGFQVCERLRGMPEYRETPVIFITSNGDFQNRARSILSGGNDLIPKPVSPVELVLKTTIRLLQPQGTPGKATTAATQRLATQSHPVAGAPADKAAVTLPPPSFIPTGGAGANGASNVPPVLEPLKLPKSENRIDFAKADAPKEPVPARTNGDAHIIPPLKMKEESATAEAPKAELPKPEPAKVEMPKLEMATAEPTNVPAPAPAAPVAVGQPVANHSEPAQPAEVKASAPAPVEAKLELKPAEPKHEEQPKAPEIKEEHKPLEAAQEPHHEISSPPAARPEPVSTPQTPTTQRSSKLNTSTKNMDTKKPTIDEAARGVAQIIFGDENITDMNVRLTRIALERYTGGTKTISEIARGVAQIIFGDENTSDMNVRLTKIALERYNVAELLGAPANDAAAKVVAL